MSFHSPLPPTKSFLMASFLHSIGTALPTRSITQTASAELASTLCCETDQQRKLVSALYRRTGVRTRHSVLLEEDSLTGEVVADPEESVKHNGSAAVNGNSHPSTDVLLLDQPAQSFYWPAVDTLDRGPTTDQRIRAYRRSAKDLALESSVDALRTSAIDANQITHLVTVSCTGFQAPGVDWALIEGLGLPKNVARTHVGFMGCHGAMNGLRVAKAFADSDPNARVLVCAVELCSLHQQYGWDHGRIVSNALFADGSAAVVVSSNAADCTNDSIELSSTYSEIIPDTEDMMTWTVGDHGFEMYLSAEVPEIIRRSTRDPLNRWLSQFDLSLDQIQSWAVHPGGPRILNACAEALQIDNDGLVASRKVLAQCGNMSSPTVLFVLRELMASGRQTPTLMLGFGPGLAMEAALIR